MKQQGFRLIEYLLGQFLNRGVSHAGRLAVFDTSGKLPLFRSIGAKITEVRWKKQIEDGRFIFFLSFQIEFDNLDPQFLGRHFMGFNSPGAKTIAVIR